MAGGADDEIPESGAVYTFGKSKFSDSIPGKFWLKNDIPWHIACGDEHTAFITENRKLFVFGSNNWGQLGLGSKVTVTTPTCVKALKSERLHLVACGRNHTLVCTAEGGLFASGGNSEGQLGLGDTEERTTFHRVHLEANEPIKVLSAGSNTSAVVTENGRLFLWGDNSEGQIGLGAQSHAARPQEVSLGCPVQSVSCGYYHSALVTVDGGLYTFGERDSGKLGLTTDQLPGHRVPQRVKGISEPVRQVCCGGSHSVALTDKDVFTFGLGQHGQLGHGTFIYESHVPRHVEHFKKGRVSHVSCGENHTALITDSGLLYTFGDGRHGKLALGEETFTNQFKPTLCPRFLHCSVREVACGGCHMVVLARPRQDAEQKLRLEEDDSTEDLLERRYVELLGHSTDSSSLNRSITARMRRREMKKSLEQFGATFRGLPVSVTLTGLLPLLSANQGKKGAFLSPGGQDEMASVTESLADTESVTGLGETTDFMNMTHMMELNSSDQSLSLSPVQKRWRQRDLEDQGRPRGEEEDEGDESVEEEEDKEEEGNESDQSLDKQGHVQETNSDQEDFAPNEEYKETLVQNENHPANEAPENSHQAPNEASENSPSNQSGSGLTRSAPFGSRSPDPAPPEGPPQDPTGDAPVVPEAGAAQSRGLSGRGLSRRRACALL